jgi:hypothetical protein
VPAPKAIVPFTIVLLLACCSHQQRLSSDDLHSQLTSTASLASEAELFIEYIQQNRSTRAYAQGHTEDLTAEVKRSAEELRDASVSPELEPDLELCRTQLELLANALSDLRSGFAKPDALSASKEKVRKIKDALHNAGSSR